MAFCSKSLRFSVVGGSPLPQTLVLYFLYSIIPWAYQAVQSGNNQKWCKDHCSDLSELYLSASSPPLSSFQNLVTIVYDIKWLRINQSKASSLISMGQKCSVGLLNSPIYILVVVIATSVLLPLLVLFKVHTICDSCWLIYPCWVLIFSGSCCFLTMRSVIKSLLRKANLCMSDQEADSNFPFDTSET